MSTYDWPESLVHRDFSAGIEANQLTPTSPFTKSVSVIDFLGERWRFSLSLPPAARDDAGVRAALFAKLRGKANKVNLWNMARPVPLGTMRGTPTLAANAAQGAQAISIGGFIGKNRLLNPSFELDSDGNGMANGWAAYSNGVTGSITYSINTNWALADGLYCQRVDYASLGVTTDHRIGLQQAITDVADLVGKPITVSCLMAFGGSPVRGQSYISVFNSSGVEIAASLSPLTNLSSAVFLPVSAPSVVVPVGAVSVYVYVWGCARLGPDAPGQVYFDEAQLEIGAVATEFEAGATLKQGDMLGINGLLTMVADDVTSDASGNMTVNLCTRLRKACTSGTAVVWNKPTSTFMLSDGYAPISYSPGIVEGLSAEFVEAW
jgi:hypothetical protein